MSFPARYRGRCPACDESIREGDLIRHGEAGDVIHDECSAQDRLNLMPGVVCPECFILRPCGCEDGL